MGRLAQIVTDNSFFIFSIGALPSIQKKISNERYVRKIFETLLFTGNFRSGLFIRNFLERSNTEMREAGHPLRSRSV